jgi:hypothetical protein
MWLKPLDQVYLWNPRPGWLLKSSTTAEQLAWALTSLEYRVEARGEALLPRCYSAGRHACGWARLAAFLPRPAGRGSRRSFPDRLGQLSQAAFAAALFDDFFKLSPAACKGVEDAP